MNTLGEFAVDNIPLTAGVIGLSLGTLLFIWTGQIPQSTELFPAIAELMFARNLLGVSFVFGMCTLILLLGIQDAQNNALDNIDGKD